MGTMRKRTTVFALCAALIIIFAVFVSFYYFKIGTPTAAVTLPPPTVQDISDNPGSSPGVTGSGNPRVEVTAETVQAVIATLARPDSYSRTVRIELFSSGGSTVYDISSWISSSASATRLDIQNGDNLQSVILTDENIYIWYNGEGPYYTGVLNESRESGSDVWQRIATYEDLLGMDADKITDAGYVEYNGVYCIYAEAVSNELGYTDKYYIELIDMDIGLLIAMETYDGDTLVYKMTAGESDFSTPADERFTLPDGDMSV